ncbi:arginine deiminase [Arcanobacterium canis]|uniref:Arginine deiminase n=1 Tax=Arcanobacterium canis TaxID=999183 RepID=A0ABY8G1Q7_9ACTO|nr:arginine deiminase [Arcanobacterium canis]WFM83566.1 arginine deiminase [Arcanobacterium canis]
MKPHVASETAPLKQVMLHRPGTEMLRLTPSNKDKLLFDDILWLEKAREEHDVFAKELTDRGIEVLYFQELLAQTLDIPEARASALQRIFTEESIGFGAVDAVANYCEQLPSDDLAALLIGGMTKRELFERIPRTTSVSMEAIDDDDFVLAPLPNHLFTRDTSCWIYDGVSINAMRMSARRRETINAEVIYRYHPRFTEYGPHIHSNGLEAGDATVEGGDVHIIGNKSVLIGMSERTCPQGVERLAARLFASGQVERVVALEMPKSRAQMHLDTVMSMADPETFVKYPGLGMLRSQVIRPGRTPKELDVTVHDPSQMHDVIAQALGLESIRVLEPPFDALTSEREQWNDGSNVLAIAPGVVVTYERNTPTNDFLAENGLEVVAIPGNELGRGRGGPRCMSCPIVREDI